MAGIQSVDRVLFDENHGKHERGYGEQQKEGQFSHFSVKWATFIF